jgi:hypothetical protein
MADENHDHLEKHGKKEKQGNQGDGVFHDHGTAFIFDYFRWT